MGLIYEEFRWSVLKSVRIAVTMQVVPDEHCYIVCRSEILHAHDLERKSC